MKAPTVDDVINMWSLTLISRAFKDMAAAFATIDREAADRSIYAIEKLLAQELTTLRDEGIKGIKVDVSALMAIAQNFREMTQGARAQIRDRAQKH